MSVPGSAEAASTSFSRTFSWSGYALGLSIGGFFDGILLHQILQWHHLLSGVGNPAFDDIRLHILADGLFHLLMYVIGALGFALLFRARRELSQPRSGKLLIANGIIGFGLWHILDAVVAHWVTGVHRIKMDSEVPLLWDMIWFVAFGLIPLAIGWMMRPKGTAPDRGRAVRS